MALIKTAQDQEAPLRIVETVVAVNDQRKRAMARKVAHALGGTVRDKTIAVLGLTFKPNTDDMREAPSIPLITALQDMGATVRAYDPAGMDQAKKELPTLAYCQDPYACAQDADALVIVTEWEQFRALDFARLKTVMARPVVVDLRNIYRSEDMARYGFSYVSVGRPGEGVSDSTPACPITPLPIDEALPDLTAAMRRHHAVVLVAPPGAGKTTRVPLVLAGEPWAANRKILVLEPRRLAARAAAHRMAATLGETVGETRRHSRAIRFEGIAQDAH